jgi:2-polyprenyl-3-methyl-5-hydroxy-6-metoxy-1,4-benzoquinol methylase
MDYRKKVYNKFLSTHFKKTHTGKKEEFELYHRYFKKNYQRFLPQDKNAEILDFGCGTGEFLYFLRKEGYENILGIDNSEECINFCRDKGFKVVKGDGVKFLAESRESYACIIMNDIIEHFKKEEILNVLALVRKRLNKNGILIIKTLNMANFLTGPRGRYMDFSHEIGFTEESLSQVLEIIGFSQVNIYPLDIYVLRNPIVNLIAKVGSFILGKIFRFLFLLYGATSTHIFTKNILAVAKR